MFVQAWRCLELLCQPLHGPVDKIASEVNSLLCDCEYVYFVV